MEVRAETISLVGCRPREPPKHAVVAFEGPSISNHQLPSSSSVSRPNEDVDVAALIGRRRAIQALLDFGALEYQNLNPRCM
jgi:hypothetical protein